MTDRFNNPAPQFGTAEYTSQPAGDHCSVCQQPMAGTYYRVHTSRVCPSCAQNMSSAIAVDNHSAYVRALAYGIGAAAAGLIGYGD
jgi:recombinational DNA repair protein (RecF pathway)